MTTMRSDDRWAPGGYTLGANLGKAAHLTERWVILGSARLGQARRWRPKLSIERAVLAGAVLPRFRRGARRNRHDCGSVACSEGPAERPSGTVEHSGNVHVPACDRTFVYTGGTPRSCTPPTSAVSPSPRDSVVGALAPATSG